MRNMPLGIQQKLHMQATLGLEIWICMFILAGMVIMISDADLVLK